jgi:hypothetical protein
MPANPTLLTLASDTACTAGTKTTVLDSGASPLIAAGAAGGWYLMAQLSLAITFGGTAPSAVTVTLDLVTAGANQDSYALPVGDLVLSTAFLFTVALFVPNSGTIWFPTGDRVRITVNPTGQAVTVTAIGTRCLLTLPQGI